LNKKSWCTLNSNTLLASVHNIAVEVVSVCGGGDYIIWISCHCFRAWFGCILNTCSRWIGWAKCCTITACHNPISLLVISLYNLLNWVRSATTKMISQVAIGCVCSIQVQVIEPIDTVGCWWLSPIEKEVLVSCIPCCKVAVHIITPNVKDSCSWEGWWACANECACWGASVWFTVSSHRRCNSTRNSHHFWSFFNFFLLKFFNSSNLTVDALI